MPWGDFLKKDEQYFQEILRAVERERALGKVIYPKNSEVFNALTFTPLEAVKVVIIGQDPYHGPNQAHGLCFSVRDGVPFPPSLQNIFKEIQADIGTHPPKSGSLERWAKQGVLLLNAVLTVEEGLPGSHRSLGWERFTDKVIKVVNDQKKGVVFLLWGAFAQKKGELIDKGKHFILEAPHPSPLSASRGFFGCKHFSKTNEILRSQGLEPIDW
jgi:uracil-DNA glycosylase